jgi:hypothetical protein
MAVVMPVVVGHPSPTSVFLSSRWWWLKPVAFVYDLHLQSSFGNLVVIVFG